MNQDFETIKGFLESWKPFSQMAPGNPARRGLTRIFESDDLAKRQGVLERVSPLYRLHKIYERLGIHREEKNEKAAQFAKLLQISQEDMARSIRNGNMKESLGLLQNCFEFGRSPLTPRFQAARTFLLEMWALNVGAPGMKFSIYASGVMYSGGGLTHDEMAKKFNNLGYGGGNPQGGGEFVRTGELAFDFDTASTAFGGGVRPEFVTQSAKRWIHVTGGQEDQVAFNYVRKVGAG